MKKTVVVLVVMALTFSPALMNIAKAGMLDNYTLKVQGVDVRETFKPRSLCDYNKNLTRGQTLAIGLGIVAVAVIVVVANDDDDPTPIEDPEEPGGGD